MQISTPSALGRTAPPPPVDSAAADAAGGDFANLLQQQAEPAAPETTSEERPETSTAASREARPRTPARPTARTAERASAPQADAKADAGGEETAGIAGDEDVPDRSLLDWLAALHLPAPAVPAADAAAAPGNEPALAAGATTPLDVLAPAARPLTDIADAGAALQPTGPQRTGARDKASVGGRSATAAPEAATDAGSTRVAAEPAEGRRFTLEGLANVRSGAAPETTALAANVAPTANTAQNPTPATPAAVPLATPLDDPQFPRAFGVQVSVLARDGVQQAELHLNPAEMGPVSVQIVMDGTQARIDFGADAAGTRQLIEHSLPDLAAALREAGLTLTGGGVSQHPSGRDGSDGQTPSGRPAETVPAGAENPATPLRRSVRAGGVDLYA
jgi:flagellar hook-length control protein FliK